MKYPVQMFRYSHGHIAALSCCGASSDLLLFEVTMVNCAIIVKIRADPDIKKNISWCWIYRDIVSFPELAGYLISLRDMRGGAGSLPVPAVRRMRLAMTAQMGQKAVLFVVCPCFNHVSGLTLMQCKRIDYPRGRVRL